MSALTDFWRSVEALHDGGVGQRGERGDVTTQRGVERHREPRGLVRVAEPEQPREPTS